MRGSRPKAPLRLVWIAAAIAVAAPALARSTPRVTAKAAVVMDARSGRLLWSRNPNLRRAPASTTKILTTVLALESGRLDETFRVSRRAQAQVPSKLYLRAGERARLRDLTYALMLKSANDAAVVVAEGLAGSVERFADRMNARARRMGARSSHFRNPSGLPDGRHYSTAHDLARILRAALGVPGFREVASTASRKLAIRRKTGVKRVTVRTKNRLLSGYRVRVIGKTGYTRAAGRCFAGYAADGDREVIVVVLGARDLWGDVRRLLDWSLRGAGRDRFPRVQLASAKAPRRPRARKASSGEKSPGAHEVRTAKLEPKAGPRRVRRDRPAARAEASPRARKASAASRSKSRKRRERRRAEPALAARGGARALASAEPRAARLAVLDALVLAPARTSALRPTEVSLLLPTPRHAVRAMGTGRSYRSGRIYFSELRSGAGVIRRGCTGVGCSTRR